MKYTVFFILALMGWNSWGLKFTCEDGQSGFQQLQRDIQNYQGYSDRYKASKHFWLAMELYNPTSDING